MNYKIRQVSIVCAFAIASALFAASSAKAEVANIVCGTGAEESNVWIDLVRQTASFTMTDPHTGDTTVSVVPAIITNQVYIFGNRVRSADGSGWQITIYRGTGAYAWGGYTADNPTPTAGAMEHGPGYCRKGSAPMPTDSRTGPKM
jgi:hypothetical protein